MANELLMQELMASSKGNNQTFSVDLSSVEPVNVYPKSINQVHDDYLFVARRDVEKHLYIVSIKGEASLNDKFSGVFIKSDRGYGSEPIKRCPLNHHNAMAIRQLFDFTKPVLIGIQNSIGLGDRLGLANPAHLRVVAGTNLKPILAQQSIRELERTHREAEDVMDAATWAVFQEGYRDGFG
ncbi:MAG: tagaturonate epimerase family protein, partial [Ignavibacteria bacterium]|nr:tagaturonate epimerase family protein [Ignavibacteria bacterium]